jgi:CheY-like chemotaxis protein/HPt (histidine-containing phosphotransfer) domain-containing protein
VASRQATVLVVDDNAVNLKVARAMLLKLGYGVQTAVGGLEAVEAIAHATAAGSRFSAVLMDLNMPGVDGLDATRQIHAAWGAGAPPIIALTAAASAGDRERCEAAGMDDYLTKPLQVSALTPMLEKWIAQPPTVGPGAPLPVSSPATSFSREAEYPATDASAAALAKAPEGAYPLLMDWSRLREFREFDDETLSVTREVISLFTADLGPRMQALEAAAAASDATALSRAAHALKGAASNLGATALQAECGRLENDAAARFPDDVPARLRDIAELCEKTRAALADWSSQAGH